MEIKPKADKIFLFFMVWLLTSCDLPENKEDQNTGDNNNLTNIDSVLEPVGLKVTNIDDGVIKEKPPMVLLIDSLIIDDEKFKVVQSYPGHDTTLNLTIINSKNDTVYVHDGYGTNGFEIEDFDKDNIMDIRLYQISNVGMVSELIMYNKSSSNFRPIKNFIEFPDPRKIENEDIWYTYHRSGCADSNWGSELFIIVNFKAIKIGDIKGIGCDGEEENGIFVYNVDHDKRVKVYSEIRKPGFYSDKWEFITSYWTKNYKKFL